jgi:hypothetical protein
MSNSVVGGISVFGEMADEPFIGDDWCQLGKAVQWQRHCSAGDSDLWYFWRLV